MPLFVQGFRIAASADAVQTLVSRLVMQTIVDVLEQQSRSALIPDAITSAILSQLTVQIRYEPLECKDVEKDITNLAMMFGMENKEPHCIIAGSTVTSICTGITAQMRCQINMPRTMIVAVPSKHTSISGTLTTTNIIMANWSRQMWQNVVNRAVRLLASDPFGSHFFSAFATVN
ncbi:hypothetical protein KIN20_003225 [Parelaphostrongylus tenuis]|uniref:Uncharacterized protein n=1 Tax=Parelaphostrongylus tenuis TaxID=148309 RepID=A0AAD5LWD5_PARTN|nr:hypothetical protein KIN20_003225 [Parelaphostrongylus tenuis]